MSGCSGDRRVPVCFDVKLKPFLDTNLIFPARIITVGRATKTDVSPFAFCYAPVNGKQTEHDDSINMRVSHQERKRPNNDDMFENCFYSLTWLSWIFPASYHPGLISSKRWRINILHSSLFSHDFLVVYFNRNVTSYFPLLVAFSTSYRHKTLTRLLLPQFDVFVKCSAYYAVI